MEVSRTLPSASPSSSNEIQVADPTTWGMDPIHWTYTRVLVRQIHMLRSLEGIPGCHILGSHSITRVEIVGVVVRVVHAGNTLVKYSIDDGTGLVDCTYFLPKDRKHTYTPFSIGETLRVIGKLKSVPAVARERYICFCEREINVQRIARCSPEIAIYHQMEAMDLSLRYYYRSF